MNVKNESKTGANIRDLKQKNRSLILKYITLAGGVSRSQLAQMSGLSKMAVGNLVADLIAMDLVEERQDTVPDGNYGRNPVMLSLSRHSPCICGMLLKRGFAQVVIADLGGAILRRRDMMIGEDVQREDLEKLLFKAYDELTCKEPRKIAAVGVSSVGPLDANRGVILNPPHYYHIENWNIVQAVEDYTGLPTYLIHDASAGALAEKLYGSQKQTENFMYLHIMNGIGSGYVLDGHLYGGNSGKCGEIGHSSINFAGPRCECGNIGCLELYANIQQLRQRYKELSLALHAHGGNAPAEQRELSWQDIADRAGRQDPAAISALSQFCDYLAYAVAINLNLLDLSCVVVGYNSRTQTWVVEKMLREKLANCSRHKDITVLHSTFGGDAPLIGSIACAAERVFDLSLPLLLDRREKTEAEPC